ncbi:unnamed protein product [Urochloa decumbens]|uniref:BHLH domain-containing protein n=1 Tax=Urochloa decumbens TaxID=240449 RepID=A0ABC9GDH2_9POAL
MMNSQGSCPEQYNSVLDPGEATGCGGDGSGVANEGFYGMFGDRQPSGDLFDLVWQGGAAGDGGSMDVQPSQLAQLPSPSTAAVAPPPSDDEMMAWLSPIVRDDELVFTDQLDNHPSDLAGEVTAAVDDQQAAPVKETADQKGEVDDQQQAADHKLPRTEEKCRADDPTFFSLRKKATGGARKTHNLETHSLTEKRRRCKINKKFKTLQQLVPGCVKSNQASTLDQTIQYIKTLQQQIQAMSSGRGMKPAAVYPVVAPPYLPPAAAAAPGVLVRPGVVLAPPPAMIPFGPLLSLLQHHQYPAAMASSPMLYPAMAAAPNVSVVASSSQRKTAE